MLKLKKEPAGNETAFDAPQPPSRIVPTPFLARLGRTLASLVVFAALGGLLVWGHYGEWVVPKFSTLIGGSRDHKDDWCSAHNVPEGECVECNPKLMPKPRVYGWCKLHGIHECPLDHPDVAQLPARPQITADDLARAQRALDFTERLENNSKCKAHERRIQFTSQETIEKAGIDVEPVWRASVVEFVTGHGEIIYDQTHTARLSTRVSGTVFKIFKQVGERVRAGEVIALVDAAEVGKAKSELLHAIVQARSKKAILDSMQRVGSLVGERMLQDAETAVSEARIRLITAHQSLANLGLPVQPSRLERVPDEELPDRVRFLGVPKEIIDSLDLRTTTGNLLPLVAPFDGVVVNRDAVVGEVADITKVLFVAVDIREVWLTLDLRLEDAKLVRLGEQVHFRPDGSNNEVSGPISWMSTEADHKTRTVKARAVLSNADGRLRANTFGIGRVILREEKNAIVVPNSAIHWEGDCYVVFVRDKDFLKPGTPKVFHTRDVRIGAKDETQTEIIAGVLPGEIVATKGSAALRAELLRGNLGEG
jgi:cobalt-zinc-cadmium efflux system membrane fusion protein